MTQTETKAEAYSTTQYDLTILSFYTSPNNDWARPESCKVQRVDDALFFYEDDGERVDTAICDGDNLPDYVVPVRTFKRIVEALRSYKNDTDDVIQHDDPDGGGSFEYERKAGSRDEVLFTASCGDERVVRMPVLEQILATFA